MKVFTLTITVLLFSTMLQAQTRDTIYLWPNEVPGETEAKHPAVQTDNTNGNVIRLTDITNPLLVVYKPEVQNDSGTSIIICPGGGYNILAIDKEGYEIAEWYNKQGYTAFVLQYRVPQKQAGAFADIQRAIRIVRSKAKAYNLDPEGIALLGFSAGGSLSANAAIRFSEDTYVSTDDIDKISSRPNYCMLLYPAYLDKGEDNSLTPALTIKEEVPPFSYLEQQMITMVIVRL